jgi:hypothetical protein
VLSYGYGTDLPSRESDHLYKIEGILLLKRSDCSIKEDEMEKGEEEEGEGDKIKRKISDKNDRLLCNVTR